MDYTKIGINEIYVVVGYLKEKFNFLKEKYKGIQIIENPYYDTCNNISSLYVAREHLENAIILDGDQYIYNFQILIPEFNNSGYNAVWKEKATEWISDVKNGIITSCNRDGGENGYQLFSISRWNEKDGSKLKKHIEIEFEEKKNTQIYWDEVPLFCYQKEYKLGIMEMKSSDMIEIDTVEELASLDISYKKLISKEI